MPVQSFLTLDMRKILTGVRHPLPIYRHGANGSAGSIPARPVFLRGYCMRLLGFSFSKDRERGDYIINADWEKFTMGVISTRFPVKVFLKYLFKGISYKLKCVLRPVK